MRATRSGNRLVCVAMLAVKATLASLKAAAAIARTCSVKLSPACNPCVM